MGYRSKNTILLTSAPHGDVSTINPAADVATGSGTANQPTVTSSDARTVAQVRVMQPRDAHPNWRAGGAYFSAAPLTVDPTSAAAGVASGTGAARQASVSTSGSINALPGVAAGAGAARQPNAAISVRPTTAAGTGAAYQASVTTPGITTAAAGVATGVGSARNTVAPTSAGFTHVTITRDYDLADGSAPTGTVYFTPSDWLRNGSVTIPAARVAARLDALGAIAIALAANTDPGTSPGGTYYTVLEVIDGQPDRTYEVTIPYNQGSTIDLSTLS